MEEGKGDKDSCADGPFGGFVDDDEDGVGGDRGGGEGGVGVGVGNDAGGDVTRGRCEWCIGIVNACTTSGGWGSMGRRRHGGRVGRKDGGGLVWKVDQKKRKMC